MVGSIRSSDTGDFTSPPDDLSLEFALDFHFKENPNHPALVYPTEGGSFLRSCTYQELVPAIHRTGRWISDAISFQRSAIASSSPAPVVIILLKTDTMMYLTVIAGLMRAGVTPFPISPRFSSTVVAHLLKISQPKAVIFNSGTRSFANRVLEEYARGRADSPILCELPAFSSLYPGHNMYESLPIYERAAGDISIMTHSSSSSALFPKVVSLSSSAILHHGEIKDFPVHQLAGRVVGGFGLELFHSFGMCIFFTMVRRGLVLGIMDPAEQTSILPADLDDIFQSFELTRPDFLITNPRALEIWAEDSEKVAALRDSSANIVYGGRFLSKSVGDRLVQNGVKLCSTYGSTESGPITLLSQFQGDDWEYWTVYPRPDVNFTPRQDGLFELIVAPTGEKDCKDYLPISNVIWNGKSAYNPGDLFIAHSTKENTYKIFGRLSDQIMLATGEMINPVELERELLKHPLVSSAVMFGHSRFSVGIVIEPVTIGMYVEEIAQSEEDFLDEIWPIIVDYNLKFPSYSSISRQMIVLANAKKPLLKSTKGLPRRPIVWHEYQDEIDALYAKESRIPK